MPTDNLSHCHGECYSCCSVFLYEHIAKLKKSVLSLTCMVEYCDNLMCEKCTVSEEEGSGRVESYCFACENHMRNQCFFEDACVGCQDCGIVLCAKILVFVTGIVTHAKFLTASIVLKGMLLEFVTVASPPPSVKTVLM
jgi:hypothetical protein